jgi:uncharacterized protein with FMN-binding domain
MIKGIRILIILFLILILLFGSACGESESRRIRKLELPSVNLSQVQDGIYTGQVEHHDNLYIAEVTVENHNIISIKILSCEGDKYDQEAMAVLDRVIKKQNISVDAVTGATKSSKLYLISIYNALTGEEIDF